MRVNEKEDCIRERYRDKCTTRGKLELSIKEDLLKWRP